jgi:hypothetical protein
MVGERDGSHKEIIRAVSAPPTCNAV